MQTKNLNELHEWHENPKDATNESLQQLQYQLEIFGQHQPLLVMENGLVIGGNQRLRVMKHMNWEKPIKVQILKVVEEQPGIWTGYVDDEKAKKTWASEDAALTEYALSHNNVAGHYKKDALEILFGKYADDIDWRMHTANTEAMQSMAEIEEKLLKAQANDDKGEAFKQEYQVVVDCEDEAHQEEIYQKLTEQGIKCKVLTL